MVNLDEVDLNNVHAALHLYVEHIMTTTDMEQHEKRDLLRSLFDLQDKVASALDDV